MKITSDSSLFTALSNFPDPAQVRDAAARRQSQRQNAVGDAGSGGRDARDAVRQDVLRRRQAAKGAEARATNTANRPESRTAATSVAGSRAAGELSSDPTRANAFRREVPNTVSKPRFVRMGQLVDITV
ncbi:MAG: hypothetical protein D6763_05345 [Alphaproteobacteria bacterium]|nr:MAG: hypothetical protein D6763_05345 [Alphaproteobacteria bacterium]